MSQHKVEIPELIRSASAPCLVIREEELKAIHDKQKTAAWAASAFTRLEADAQEWLKVAVEFPDCGGQWPHWYACENDGNRLVTEDPKTHRCPKCGRIYSGEPWDSVPLTAVHNGLSQAVLKLGVYYALTRKKEAAVKAAEILMGYTERYPNYPLRDHMMKSDTAWATKVSWGSLGESVWLIPVCGGYDLIRHADVLTPADHHCIREQLLRPAAKLILKHNIGIHNIQCWHNGAIGSAGLLLRDRDLVSFAVEGEVGICRQIAQGVQKDGFWFEGSWGYHFYGMTPLLAWTEALRNCGLDLYDAHFKRMFEAPFLAVRPDGGLPAFHDSGGPPLSGTARNYEIAYTRYGDARFAWPLVRSDRGNLDALLYGAVDLPEQIPETETTTHLSHAGFVYLRQGPKASQSYLALDYGPHGGGHGHPDKLGFIFCVGDEMLAPDPGSVAYGIPIHQKWYKQTVSHNTMAVDGHSQAPCTGKLNFLVNGPDFDLVSASADEAYDGVRMFRTLLFMDGLVLMIDRLFGERTHTFDWIYHNRGRLKTGFGRKRMAETPGEADGYEVIEKPQIGHPEGNWCAMWRTEGLSVRLTMMGSKRPTEVITGLGMDNAGAGLGSPGEVRTPLVIARRHSRQRSTFEAVLQVFKNRPVSEQLEPAQVAPSSRARGLTLCRGKSRLTLIHTLNSGPVAWGDVTYEGQALFAHTGGRRADRIALADGTRLTWGDLTWTLKAAGSVLFEKTKKGLRLTNLGDAAVEVNAGGAAVTLAPGERRAV